MNLRLFAAAVAFIFATGIPNPASVIAQDAPCDARPRWLVVTVVSVTLSDALDDTEDVEFGHRGAQVMDRCGIIAIREPWP